MRKKAGLFTGLAAFSVILLFFDLQEGQPEITAALAVAVLMAVWWISEALPLAITALLPVVLFPLLGVMDGKLVSSQYFNHIIFLFLGGFLMAGAMEKHGLHRRIALRILLVTGKGFGSVLLGFMLAAGFLSAWMSNTATAMMMVPVVLSVITKLSEFLSPSDTRRVTYSLLFGIAYAASAGGIATLIGTPPNLSFARIFNIMFPAAPEISFSRWLFFALPLSFAMTATIWLLLFLRFRPKDRIGPAGSRLFRKELAKLGKVSFEEKVIFTVFVAMVLLWIFRTGIETPNISLPGWSRLLPEPQYVNDGTVAIIAALLLFLIPARNASGKILGIDAVKKLPWDIVLLFGGGFALAKAFSVSGLALWLGEHMQFAGQYPLWAVIGAIALFMSLLTELTSNTASAEMFLPILAGTASAVEVHPLFLMLPATAAASLAFMLPVATPPNAVVFGTGKLSAPEMAKTGVLLNLVGVIFVTLVVYYSAPAVFDFRPEEVLPDWVVNRPTEITK